MHLALASTILLLSIQRVTMKHHRAMLEARRSLYSEVYGNVDDLTRDLEMDAVELPPPPPPAPAQDTAAVTKPPKQQKEPKQEVDPTVKSSTKSKHTRQSDIWGNPTVPDFFVVCSVCGQKVNGPRFTTHLVCERDV